MVVGSIFAVLLAALWLYLILRISRYQLRPATELRHAIASGRISVRYQPVIDMRNSICVGAEALARWQRESGAWASPSMFIPLAEESGLIQDLTISMIRSVVRDLPAILRQGAGLSVNVNLSHDDLCGERIGRALATALEQARLPASAIKLEITERALINSDAARAMIREFRERGHEVAVDDFGTGYSSLSYLQSFELDILKIDKSFVDAIGTGAATSQVIVHVIDMAASLGLKTVAEGVETAAQRRWLVEHGVQFGQGYLYSEPLPLGDFIDFIRSHATAAAD